MRLDFLTKPLFRRTTLWIFQDYWNRIAFSRSFVFHGNPAEFLFRISSTGIFGIPTVFFFQELFVGFLPKFISRPLREFFSDVIAECPKKFLSGIHLKWFFEIPSDVLFRISQDFFAVFFKNFNRCNDCYWSSSGVFHGLTAGVPLEIAPSDFYCDSTWFPLAISCSRKNYCRNA